MNTQKAAYWIALAVFGLALHSEYQHGAFPFLRRDADHAGTTLCRLVRHAEQGLAMARLLAARPATNADDFFSYGDARELAEAQSQLFQEQAHDQAELLLDQGRAQVAMVRSQINMQRSQLDRIRQCVRSQIRVSANANRRVIMIGPDACDETGARVAITSIVNSPDDDRDAF